MSLAGFDTLRANQIDRAAAIDRLEGVMTSLLQRHRDSVIDDQIVAQITRIQPRTVLDDLLAALVKAGRARREVVLELPERPRDDHGARSLQRLS